MSRKQYQDRLHRDYTTEKKIHDGSRNKNKSHWASTAQSYKDKPDFAPFLLHAGSKEIGV